MKALFGTLAAALFLVSNVYADTAHPAAGTAPVQDSASASAATTEKTSEKEVKADGSSQEKKVEKTETKKKQKKH